MRLLFQPWLNHQGHPLIKPLPGVSSQPNSAFTGTWVFYSSRDSTTGVAHWLSLYPGVSTSSELAQRCLIFANLVLFVWDYGHCALHLMCLHCIAGSYLSSSQWLPHATAFCLSFIYWQRSLQSTILPLSFSSVFSGHCLLLASHFPATNFPVDILFRQLFCASLVVHFCHYFPCPWLFMTVSSFKFKIFGSPNIG